jgi:surface antigen
VKKNLFFFLALMTLFVMTQNIYAFNMQYLKYSPVSKFTDKDWEILKETGKKVLNNGKDGETVSWENQESDNHGSFKPVSTSTANGQTCRVIEIRNYSGNLSGKAVYTFCKQDDGKWKVSGGK